MLIFYLDDAVVDIYSQTRPNFILKVLENLVDWFIRDMQILSMPTRKTNLRKNTRWTYGKKWGGEIRKRISFGHIHGQCRCSRQNFICSDFWCGIYDYHSLVPGRVQRVNHTYAAPFTLTWNAIQLITRLPGTFALILYCFASSALRTPHLSAILGEWVPFHCVASNAIIAPP